MENLEKKRELFDEHMINIYKEAIRGLEYLMCSTKKSEHRTLNSYQYEKKRHSVSEVIQDSRNMYNSYKNERKKYEKALKHLKKSYNCLLECEMFLRHQK